MFKLLTDILHMESDLFAEKDKVVGCFYSNNFSNEGNYLKTRREEIINQDKQSEKPKLLINGTKRKINLRSVPFKIRKRKNK